MRKIILTFIYLSFFISCKKDSNHSNTNNIENRKGVVFVNITDPRLAEIDTQDGQIITFFGQREADGTPKRLSGYSITSITDQNRSDFVGLDNNGRYTNIFLKTGEKMHIDYTQTDSVRITISGADSVSNVISSKISTTAKHNNPLNIKSAKTSSLKGSDKNINIKVTSKNSYDQIEKDVKNDETVVIIELNAGQNRNYSLQAHYDVNTGLYSMPLSAAGFTYNDNNAIDKTIGVIKSALAVACTGADSGDINLDKSILELIKETVCPLPHPYAQAICVAAKTLLFACDAGKFTDMLNDLVLKIDPNAMPSTNATVKAYSQHYKYGTKYSTETTLDQIILNQGSYDIKIVHDYTEKVTPVSLKGSTYSLIRWRYGATVPGDINFQSPANPPVYTYEPGQEFFFDKDATFTVTSFNIPPSPNSTASGFPYRLGAYSPDSLFLNVPGSGPTNSYGHQYPEGWGLKLPPGFDLFILNDVFISRLTSDGQYIYRGQNGDMVYKKK